MIIDVARLVVLIFGIVIAVLSIWGIYAPRRLIQIVKGVMEHDLGIHFAVLVRLVMGAALILVAAGTRFPGVFAVLGWITIVAAVALPIVGKDRLRRFIAWFDRSSPGLVRLWLIFGITFGGFLIYGVYWLN